MLSGLKIKELVEKGEIEIYDFDESRLNPNSYNLRLHNELLVYDTGNRNNILDMKVKIPTKTFKMDHTGFLLLPGTLYLGRTVETTYTPNHVPAISGRSSTGRYGLNIHATAGFGDVGFMGSWTLEISVVQPVRVYPFIEICQLYLEEIQGDFIPYKGKYQNQKDIEPSKFYTELNNK